jgi:hypothetical protein
VDPVLAATQKSKHGNFSAQIDDSSTEVIGTGLDAMDGTGAPARRILASA